MQNEKSVVIYDGPEGRSVVDIVAIPDWDGFDKVIAFLKQEYDATVISSVDGPDSRRTVLEIRGVRLALIHDDPYGNTIEANTSESNGLVRAIGMDLTYRLTASELLPCPCCGSATISARGTFDICEVCQWEDDPAQSADPNYAGGANRLSLYDARTLWMRQHPD